jgi:type II secretory pathway component GspD/PulD (secretin)
MFKNFGLHKVVSAVLLAACVGVATSVSAQPPDEPTAQFAPVKPPPIWRSMKLRYASAGLVAWRLDPKHQPEPIAITFARKMERLLSVDQQKLLAFSRAGKTSEDDIFKGEGKIDAIAFSNVSGDILALADDTGWTRFQRRVAKLDRPLQQVEISATVIEMDDRKAESLNWRDDASGVAQRTMPTTQFEQLIKDLRAKGDIHIINSPRFITFNNLTAGMGQSQYIGASLTLDTGLTPGEEKTLSPLFNPPARAQYSAQQFVMGCQSTLVATPIINNDGSVTLFVTYATPLLLARTADLENTQKEQEAQISFASNITAPEKLFLENNTQITTVARLTPDETVFIGGLKTRTSTKGETPESKPKVVERGIYYFVSAHVVR